MGSSAKAEAMKRMEDLRQGTELHGDNENSSSLPPSWLDKDRFHQAKEVFQRYFFSIFFAHLSGLLFLVFIPNMLNPLLYTGNSSNLVRIFRRYVSTMRHVRKWYEGDIWNSEDAAYESITITRRMHKNVADRLNDKSRPISSFDSHPNIQKDFKTQITCPCQGGVVMSQYDMALTQFSFIGLIVLFPQSLGIHCSREELESLIHFWRGVGYQLGLDDRFNICDGSLKETEAICREIMNAVWKPTIKSPLPESVQMSKDIIQAMSVVVPFLNWTAMMKFWCRLLDISFKKKTTYYMSICYWLMYVAFEILLKFFVFRVFFNTLIKVAYWRTVKWQGYLEKKLERVDTESSDAHKKPIL
ncbi:uncharacterized protein LOC143254540 [Tachypleus tridentatus]|uniref:uncharacterized protein LOC143254540 n=1 Tax=Tachypleus tridentatus TaxID=6853 RepID=UPI003FD4436E